MAVRTRYKVEVSISSTASEEKDLGNVRWEIVTDKQGEGGGWKTLLAAGAVDIQLPLDSIATVRLLVIRTNAKDPNQNPADILIRRNLVGAEQILIKPLTDSKEGHFLISTDGLTALFASNPGTVAMELTLLVAGD
jgi:hypothetical protein